MRALVCHTSNLKADVMKLIILGSEFILKLAKRWLMNCTCFKLKSFYVTSSQPNAQNQRHAQQCELSTVKSQDKHYYLELITKSYSF